MREHFVLRLLKRWQPREGWLLFGLTLSIVYFAARSVSLAEWVPEDGVVWVALWTSTLVSYALVWRSNWWPWFRWLILLCYLVVTSSWFLMRLQPTLVFWVGWDTYISHTQRGWLLFQARINGWISSVSAGTQSSETLVFAFGLALLVGLLTAFFINTVYRRRRPLVAISVMLVLIGLNDVYSGEAELLLLFIIILAIVYLTLWQQYYREADWEAQEIDYSAEMNLSTMVIAVVVTFSLVFTGVILPSLPYSSVARWFQQSAVVQAFEESFEQYFSGVNTNPATAGGIGGGGGVLGADGLPVALSGILPRSYLLGNPPELADTPVFSATILASQPLIGSQHWRSGTYDIYTGFGWRQSPPVETMLITDQELVPTLSPIATENNLSIELEQTVTWLAEDRYFNLLTLGQPLAFDQPVSAFIRPNADLSHVGRLAGTYQPTYQATSIVVQRDRAVLSQISTFPAEDFYEHHTALPDSIPGRVSSLAEQITAGATSPYEQAVLLEQYLRQYPYNLDIPPIPRDVDPVDYFLFDLQQGYCDLYASSMVVMARSLGLPARLGVGYLNGSPDENGQILITQDRGHSWAEIYFPDVGWVEFEPTASFPISSAPANGEGSVAEFEPDILLGSDLPEILELPQPRFGSNIPAWVWGSGGLLTLFLVVAVWQAYRWRRDPEDMGELLFWLQDAAGRLDYPVDESETATEFGRGFLAYLQIAPSDVKQRVDLDPFLMNVPVLIDVYEADRFSLAGVERRIFDEAVGRWQAIRRPLWQLWLSRRWQKAIAGVRRPKVGPSG
ncbi:MAG: transglutaminase family protein [Anaerolineae bacterium]